MNQKLLMGLTFPLWIVPALIVFVIVTLFFPVPKHAHAVSGNLTFLQATASSTDATVYTFTGQNLGTASTDRYIIVNVTARNDPAAISSVSVAGITATLVGSKVFDGTSEITGIYIAAVPTGTSGSVVVTLGSAGLRCGIALWSATGLASATASDVQSAAVAGSGRNPAPSVNLTVPANGFAIGTTMSDNNAVNSVAWTGLTSQYTQILESQSRQSGASATFDPAQSPLVVTASWTSTANNVGLVAASWAFTNATPVVGLVHTWIFF